MKTYTAEELQEILNQHKLWLQDQDGERANLSGADLSGVNLSGANLRGAIGNLRHIKSLQSEKYYVTYTSEILQIGCQRHTIEEWKIFDDTKITNMDSGALEWWNKWKPVIFQLIEMSPAEPTKNEGA